MSKNPNPGVANRFAAKGVMVGLGLGILIGAVWGLYGMHIGWAGAFGGALLGALAGLALGLLGSLALAAVARVAGVR